LLVISCAPAIAVATGVFVATAAACGSSLAAAAAAANTATALPPRAQWMSGRRWEHCLIFGRLVC
jgi:hypothetical protein